MKKSDQKALVDQKKTQIAQQLMGGISDEELKRQYGTSTTDMLNPVNRQALSEIAANEEKGSKIQTRINNLTEGMDVDMMVNTMKKTGEQQRENLVAHYQSGEDEKRLAREYERSESGKTYLGGEGKTLEESEQLRDRTKERVANNFTRTQEDAENLADKDIARSQNASDAMRPGAAIYVFHADNVGLTFRQAFKDAGLKMAQCLIWEKNQFVIGRQT